VENENPCLGRTDLPPSTTRYLHVAEDRYSARGLCPARLDAAPQLARSDQTIAGGDIAFVAPSGKPCASVVMNSGRRLIRGRGVLGRVCSFSPHLISLDTNIDKNCLSIRFRNATNAHE
jgi:hypothetical protein